MCKVEPTVYKTDLDRLHKVSMGDIAGRGCGKTYLVCHELCTVVELGQVNVVLAKIKKFSDTEFILPMLTGIMKERGIVSYSFKRIYNRLTINDVIVWFTPESRLDLVLRGLGYRKTIGFVDFVDY